MWHSKDHRSITRKLATYYHGGRTQPAHGAIRREAGASAYGYQFRGGVENMIAAVRDITGGRGSNFFLFNDRPREQFAPSGVVERERGESALID